MKGTLWPTDVAQVVQLLQVCFVYQQSQENGGATDNLVPQVRFGVLQEGNKPAAGVNSAPCARRKSRSPAEET